MDEYQTLTSVVNKNMSLYLKINLSTSYEELEGNPLILQTSKIKLGFLICSKEINTLKYFLVYCFYKIDFISAFVESIKDHQIIIHKIMMLLWRLIDRTVNLEDCSFRNYHLLIRHLYTFSSWCSQKLWLFCLFPIFLW